MRFLTKDEVGLWWPRLQQGDETGRTPQDLKGYSLADMDITATPIAQLRWLSRDIVAALGEHEDAVLLIQYAPELDGDNLHAYYRLRQSYGDFRLVREAPAHLFLGYEDADLLTFLQIGMLNLWTMHLFTGYDYGRAVISNDQWVQLAMLSEPDLNAICARIEKRGTRVRRSPPTK